MSKRKYQKASPLTQIHIIEKNNNPVREILKHPLSDPYHWLLIISWPRFLAVISLFFFVGNFLFALLYVTAKDGIANAKPGSFSDLFFFSVHTVSTIGYGSMYPTTFYAQVLVTVEVLVGILLVALLTGLIFARFARPTSRVLFSQCAVISPFDGAPTLMFRVGNQRNNRILEAQIGVSLLRNEVSIEGHQLRRFYDLKLLRSRTPTFSLTWLVMHPLDSDSPLYDATVDSLLMADAEIIVTLIGIDETFSQTIHARHVYTASEIFWNMRFVDIFTKKPNAKEYIVDYARFHDVIPVVPSGSKRKRLDSDRKNQRIAEQG
jgi:inward rectifier potassium channel